MMGLSDSWLWNCQNAFMVKQWVFSALGLLGVHSMCLFDLAKTWKCDWKIKGENKLNLLKQWHFHSGTWKKKIIILSMCLLNNIWTKSKVGLHSKSISRQGGMNLNRPIVSYSLTDLNVPLYIIIISTAVKSVIHCKHTTHLLWRLTQYPRGSRSAHSMEQCTLKVKHTHKPYGLSQYILIVHYTYSALKQTRLTSSPHRHTCEHTLQLTVSGLCTVTHQWIAWLVCNIPPACIDHVIVSNVCVAVLQTWWAVMSSLWPPGCSAHQCNDKWEHREQSPLVR